MEGILAVGVAAGTALLISVTKRICYRTLRRLGNRSLETERGEAECHA